MQVHIRIASNNLNSNHQRFQKCGLNYFFKTSRIMQHKFFLFEILILLTATVTVTATYCCFRDHEVLRVAISASGIKLLYNQHPQHLAL